MMEYDDSLYHWQNFFKIAQLVKFFQISKVYPKAAPRGVLIKKVFLWSKFAGKHPY